MFVNTSPRVASYGQAAPIAAAQRAREHHHRAIERRRREHPFRVHRVRVPQRPDSRRRARASASRSPWRDRTSCARAAAARRERLRGPRGFARHVTLRDGTLLEAEQRLTGDAIEDEERAHLGDLGDRRDPAAVLRHLDQRRRGGQIPVPNVVVNELVKPLQPAGCGIERDQRVAVEILPFRSPP